MRAAVIGIWIVAQVNNPRELEGQERFASQQSGSLRVVVRSQDGSPAAGALVAILDRNGQVVADGLTNSLGERALAVAPGSYRARILRIGYEPTWSDWTTVNGDTRLEIALNEARIKLNTLVVRNRTACTRTDQDPQGTGLVWAEITKALRASQLTIRDSDSLSRAGVYRKLTESEGLILSSDTTWMPIHTTRPFYAIDPAVLARNGYVRGSVGDGYEFFGPDERVLLSDEFAATHCFQLVRDHSRKDVVGVAFEPVPGRRTADIAGTIWVDDKTSELREITFGYVRANIPKDFDAGGYTRFQRVTSGAWIISDWQMRMPRAEIRRVPMGYGYPDREVTEIVGSVEFGGGVEVRESRSTAGAAGLSRLAGVAFDSVTNGPLIGATIHLGGAIQLTDSAGRFVFDGIRPGMHRMTVSHPSLASLGYAGLEHQVYVAGDSAFATLSTPSPRRMWNRLCRDAEYDPRNWRGIVHGVVMKANGQPFDDAVVRFNWQIIRSPTGPSASIRADLSPMKLEVRTDSAGRYAACGFTLGAQGTISLPRSKTDSPLARFSMTDSRVVRVDLSAQ